MYGANKHAMWQSARGISGRITVDTQSSQSSVPLCEMGSTLSLEACISDGSCQFLVPPLHDLASDLFEVRPLAGCWLRGRRIQIVPPPRAGLEHGGGDVAEMPMVRKEQYLCLLGQVSQYR